MSVGRDPTITARIPKAHTPESGEQRQYLRSLLSAVPVAAVALLLILVTWSDGGFDLRYWALIAILTLAILVSAQLGGGFRGGHGPLGLAVAAIWAFALWTLLSALWADSPARAWEGAERTFLYAAIVTLAITLPGRRQALWVGSAITGGVAVVALVMLVSLHVDGPDRFLAGRLDDPIGYRNATATLFALAFWPLIGIAAVRNRLAPLRAAAFAVAVLALGLAFLTQSRGMAIGIAAGALVFFLIGPDRLRRACYAVIAAAGVALASGPMLAPYHAFQDGEPVTDSVVDEATTALTLLTLAAFAIGLFGALLDNGLRASAAGIVARRVAVAGLAGVAAVCAVGALIAIGNPISYADEKWEEFTDLDPGAQSETTRLGSVGGQRYDIWRVSWSEFTSHPLTGVGEGNYLFDYYAERRTDRNLTDPHSLPFRLLAETGLVGTLLFAVFLAALGVAVARSARSSPPGDRRVIAGLAAAGAVVLGQSTTDWLWLIPTVTGLGLLSLALAAVPRGRAEDRPASLELPWSGASWSRVSRFGLAAVLGAVAVSAAVLFISDLHLRGARAELGKSPDQQLSEARQAEDLNPISVEPLFLIASALESKGDREGAKAALEDALEIEPDNFVTLVLLGDFEIRGGDARAATAFYEQALALNPRDVGLQQLAAGAG